MAAKEKPGYTLVPSMIDVFVRGEKAAGVEDDYVILEQMEMCAAEFEDLYRGIKEALKQTESG